ncbi:TetR family transcriptional regulator [Aeromicrobium sp. Root236]|uniref:TetR/AcrR family transcriptional regulator n=1 Tax=Aeromicrobium sp. Root236 TaxID=1736498 RepID=UPI0006F8EC09|nr:TetR/AcrR family transcriptional regulator [Aeromicrobium sp. Root236]KRC63379.1 TetR family transcriptional regulator [Aeromicrobium sp. Root236]
MVVARTARERARAEITAEILAAARAQLGEVGPSQLSLRAVAREVGMVSSAVYRYYASRDELLTALIIAAYDELGAAAEAADEAVEDRTDHLGRWMATCRATREWAVSHPHDYALIYGSPVPGYAAPQDTVVPATRVIVRLVEIIVAAHASGSAAQGTRPPAEAADPSDVVADAMAFIAERSDVDLEALPELVMRTLMVWSAIFGTLSFEIFGHLKGSVSDYEGYYEQTTLRLAGDLGLAE